MTEPPPPPPPGSPDYPPGSPPPGSPAAPSTPATPPPPPPPPAYPAPSAYPGPPAYGVPPRPTTNGFAVASMVIGIVQFVLCLLVVGAVLALVFGYKGRREIDESGGTQTGRGMATAGIVLGWVGVGFTALFVVLMIIGAATDSGSS